jgi:predicted dienelactone hydrolase
MVTGAAICLLMGRWTRTGRLFMTGALLVLVAHAVLEGAHWQMTPAYAGAGILCLAAWRPGAGRIRFQRFTAWPALLLASASVLFSFLLPMFSLPEPTGPYPVGTSILYFKDSTRIEDAAPAGGSARELMVQLWYPAQPSHDRFARYREPRETNALSSYQSVIPTHSRLDAPVALTGAPFPVILFNHAWGGRRTNDTFLTEELASRGYIVASIDHTYNASLVAFPDGRVVRGTASSVINNPDSSTEEQVRAIWDKELAKSVADQRFILDRLEAMNRAGGSPWFGRLDTNMVGAIGHSFGGAAATAMCAEDRRVHAAVNMDGWFFRAILERGPNQPLLVIDATTEQAGETHDSREKVDAALDATDFADMETSLHKFGGYLLSVKGAAHQDFTDQPLISPLRSLSHRGAVPAPEIQNIVRSYVVAFFGKTLRGEDPKVLRASTSPYAEASLEAWPASKKGIVSSIGSDGQ